MGPSGPVADETEKEAAMDTRDLKVFVAVYETKSSTRAAKNQFLSPQGCSKIIQKIEGELSTSLFARNHFLSLIHI